MRYAGKTALVTGASAGLGAEYARQLAGLGADLILTARREDRLAALADALRAKGRSVQIIPADLAARGAPASLMRQVSRPIDILVNNAGFGLPGTYAQTTWADQDAFLRLMLTAPSELAHHAMTGMQSRGWGRIVNVASLAGIAPGSAGHTLYGATKAFLISFSQSLDAEGKAHGVRAQACCPGFTYTEFHDVNGTREQTKEMPDALWMQADAVVTESLGKLEGGPVVMVPGKVNKTLARTIRMLGPDAAGRLFEKQARKFRKVD